MHLFVLSIITVKKYYKQFILCPGFQLLQNVPVANVTMHSQQ